MKRVGYLYEKIYSMENLSRALDKACQHKKDRPLVKRILNNRARYLSAIRESLINESYQLHPGRHKILPQTPDQKERDLLVPKFYPDQIIQWAVCLQLRPLFMKGMYKYCCGSVPDRGGIYGKKYIDKIVKENKNKDTIRYTLKLDIRKFFPSVSNDKLKELFRTKIKDKKTLRLLDAIIDNGGAGLPIGNYSSQWFSNFYLQKVDHYIKENIGIKCYIRYADDMVLMDGDKNKLHKAKDQIDQFLKDNNYEVLIKDNWQLWETFSRPLDFLGFRFYANKTLLRKKIFLKLNRRIRKIKKKGYCTIGAARGLSSSMGWLYHIPSGKGYYMNKIRPNISKKEISKIVSIYDKNKQRRINVW